MSETTKETVTFTLNNKAVTVPRGWTVMQTAKREGVEIPHFCWHPGLSIAGVCRFCMVKVEGRPKLEIACNLTATDGMIVSTETEEVKHAHKWALEFHLANHPLDCPICDQAGECGLQDYYMSVGKYQSQMTRPKVLKPKALSVGGDLVLDTERCILCSRCVRFEEEVTKTNGLGIFDRGDRATIGIYEDKKITHNYTANLVDICPVGAFTSKDFRFKQRVWFLDEKDATCIGCSTGCQVKVYGKSQTRQYYRIKPRESEVNGHWMCDKGRKTYLHLAPAERQRSAYLLDADAAKAQKVETRDLIKNLAATLNKAAQSDVALLISPSYTTEELDSLFGYFANEKGIKNIFQWRDANERREDFDGLLYRGDHNPNTMGMQRVLEKYGFSQEVKNGFSDCVAKSPRVLIVLAPEIDEANPQINNELSQLLQIPFVSLWTTRSSHSEIGRFKQVLPLKAFAEKRGSLLNYQGREGLLADPFLPINDQVLGVDEVIALLRATNN